MPTDEGDRNCHHICFATTVILVNCKLKTNLEIQTRIQNTITGQVISNSFIICILKPEKRQHDKFQQCITNAVKIQSCMQSTDQCKPLAHPSQFCRSTKLRWVCKWFALICRRYFNYLLYQKMTEFQVVNNFHLIYISNDDMIMTEAPFPSVMSKVQMQWGFYSLLLIFSNAFIRLGYGLVQQHFASILRTQ